MSRRTEKFARLIQVQLAEIINYRLNDPRVEGMVAVSSVEVSADLSCARVLVTGLNASEARMRTTLRALRHAAGRLRAMLGERVDTRVVPRLDFGIDEQAIRTRQTLEAIERAMRQTRVHEPPPDAGEGQVNEADAEKS